MFNSLFVVGNVHQDSPPFRLPAIDKDYLFSELVNPVYAMTDNQVTAIVTVKYLDQETKVTQYSQFELILEKQDNWKIVR